MERIAKEICCREYKFELLDVGLVVPNKFSWLGVSPDGLIKTKDRPGFGVLEIKCLYSLGFEVLS